MGQQHAPQGFWGLLDAELQQEVLQVIDTLNQLESELEERGVRLAKDEREETVVWRDQLQKVAQEVKAVSSSLHALQTMPIPEPYQQVEGFQLSQEERMALHSQMAAFLARLQEMSQNIPS